MKRYPPGDEGKSERLVSHLVVRREKGRGGSDAEWTREGHHRESSRRNNEIKHRHPKGKG